MTVYKYYIHNRKTGVAIAEVPLTGVSFTDALSGIGTATGTISLTHEKATRTIFGGKVQGGRELSIVRNDTKCVWHGPIIKRRASLRDGNLTITCADPFWYLSKRTFEGERRYTRVPAQIARDLFVHATTKSNGSLYRYTMDNVTAGTVLAKNLSGSTRANIAKEIMDLTMLDTNGFDFRFDYTWNAALREVSRNLRVGVPTIGTQITSRVLEIGSGLTDLVVEEDEDRAGNRIHIIGGGTGAQKKRASVNHTASLNTHVLLEQVYELADVTSQAVVNSMANFYRVVGAPPIASYTASYRPTEALPYDWCAPGDSVRLRSPYGYFDDDNFRRIPAITTTIDDNGLEEEITLNFFAPDE